MRAIGAPLNIETHELEQIFSFYEVLIYSTEISHIYESHFFRWYMDPLLS